MKRFLVLCGGVGGAKLVLGLSRILPPDALVIAVNTGDDFDHMGLTICPDIDTVSYTLAGLVHPEQGWGRTDESFSALAVVEQLGGTCWFRLGDKDLGLHLTRRTLLDKGMSLSTTTAYVARQLGVTHLITPMTDDTVRTIIETPAGPLSFQEYFVREQCAPMVTGIHYTGASTASPSPLLASTMVDPNLAGVIICPSNPYLSIDPILSLPGIRTALASLPVPVIAVSPVIAGKALKGPTVKIMQELGLQPSAARVARHYGDFLDGYLIDLTDSSEFEGSKPEVRQASIIMRTLDDKVALARHCLTFLDELSARQ